MSKVIQNKGGIGMGAPYDIPGYEYDPVNDTFKDLETGKIFAKDYVAPGTGTGTSTVKLETNKEVSITANGEIEITPTSGKDAMEKVTANVAVPVPVLEDNKAATIDVSTYTEPVEITPTSGKDGMKKNTVTLTNIPSGGSATAYCWTINGGNVYLSIDTAPNDPADIKIITPVSAGIMTTRPLLEEGDTYTKVSDTEFTLSVDTFTRDSTKDFTLWG